MPWISTQDLKHTGTIIQGAVGPLRGMDLKQVYNGLDCMITREVLDELQSVHGTGPNAVYSTTYNFERALQGPYLEIMLRGIKIDETARRSAAATLRARLAHLGSVPAPDGSWVQVPGGVLQQLARAVWERPLNPRSTKQLQDFFYKHMLLPEQWISKKGVRKLSMDRETLEKLEVYFYARPIIATILAIRDLGAQLKIFETEVDPDGRWRTSYNIAGTETGRPSSSKSSEGTGSNTQNIDPALRYPFIADDGWKFCNIDAAQSEARDVGFLQGTILGDWTYLDSCESGDLHTNNARLIWPELPWTGDLKRDLAIAETEFYYGFSHRDMSKKGGHLKSYYGTDWTAARSLKVPLKTMEMFTSKWLAAFPAFPRWWDWTKQKLQIDRELTTPFGFHRIFFGRPNDDATLREAIAFVPQSMTAQRVNLGMWRLWRYFGDNIQLLGNGFDSTLFQYREEDEAEIIPKALELMQVPLVDPKSGRKLLVPNEAKIGWNWMDQHREDKDLHPDKNRYNPNGLKKWRGERDTRKRLVGMEKPIL